MRKLSCILSFSLLVLLISVNRTAEGTSAKNGNRNFAYPSGYVDFYENVDSSAKVVSSLYITIAAIGLLANGTVFFVILCGNEINKTVTAMYVVHLAFADSIFLIALLFFAKQGIDQEWKFGAAACTICQTIKSVNYNAGIFFLTAMSIDRYIAVAFSTKAHKLRTKRRATSACVVVWLASIIMAIPAILYARAENVGKDSLCIVMYPGHHRLNKSDLEFEIPQDYLPENISEEYKDTLVFSEYVFIEEHGASAEDTTYELQDSFPNGSYNETTRAWVCWRDDHPMAYYVVEVTRFILGFVIPFVIITVCYGLIIKQLRLSESRLANKTGQRTHQMRKRVTRMVSALVICFVVCWLPYHIFTMAQFKGFNLTQPACYTVEMFVAVFGYANSAFNPLLYTFLGHSFHERLSGSLDKARRRISRAIGSGPQVLSRRQSNRNRCSSKRAAAPALEAQHENGQFTNRCERNCATAMTENQGMLEGRRGPAAETNL